MAGFGGSKEHGRCIFAGRHTGSATDTSREIHGFVGVRFRNRNRVGVLGGTRTGRDVATGRDDAVESGAIDHQVTNATEWCSRLLQEEGVALVPGAAFGDDRWVRMSFATSDDIIEQALRRIASSVGAASTS